MSTTAPTTEDYTGLGRLGDTPLYTTATLRDGGALHADAECHRLHATGGTRKRVPLPWALAQPRTRWSTCDDCTLDWRALARIARRDPRLDEHDGTRYVAAKPTKATVYHFDRDCHRVRRGPRDATEASESLIDWHGLEPCPDCADVEEYRR